LSLFLGETDRFERLLPIGEVFDSEYASQRASRCAGGFRALRQ
jgi:hypothetical protein